MLFYDYCSCVFSKGFCQCLQMNVGLHQHMVLIWRIVCAVQVLDVLIKQPFYLLHLQPVQRSNDLETDVVRIKF